MSETCAGCGLEIAGGTAGCQALADACWAREFGHVLYFRVHRMSVDAYALQHPDRYCASAKSLAAHLAGLCCAFEHPGERALLDSLQRWLSGNPSLDKPPWPAWRGALTVASVDVEAGPEAYGAAVERWARCTWEAWAPLHDLARSGLAEAGAIRG